MKELIGKIYRRSWGYDQTNVDYFQVVRVTAKCVVVREIASKQVSGTDCGGMSCYVVPDRNKFLPVSPEKTCKINPTKDSITVGPRERACLVPTDTTRAYCSWYA